MESYGILSIVLYGYVIICAVL